MLSEFEVAKPNRKFSQLHLEYYELTFMSMRGSLLVDAYRIPGKLHLNSRSFIFEPEDAELPLIKLKYCDSLRLTILSDLSMKTFLSKYANQASGASLSKPETALGKVFTRDGLKSRLVKTAQSGTAGAKGRIEVFQVSIKKFIVIDRNPPSPYSVDRCDKEIFIEVEEREKVELFLRYYEEITKAEDDDQVLAFVASRVNRTMKKYITDSKEKIVYYAPCRLVQLFEQFYGFVVIKATKVMEFIPVINVTKDVELKIPLREVKYVNDHRYMFRPVGLEVFVYYSNESFLFVFNEQDARDTIKEILSSNAPKMLEMHLDVITKMWMNGILSNYDYLVYLNRFSSRSFNDISQYPIFPWIIHEFGDDEFKLNSKSYYRDLSKPIGAINKHRMQIIRKNYEKQQRDKCQKHPAHHFNSFYSTPGYIIYFYMRSIPELILKLQNGPFGPSERIFKSLESLWLNIQNTGCNLTELIPEFYTPNKADFLLNAFRLDLGYTQEGEEIDDVQLPRWAEDMQDFMFYMRAALESDFTSVNLHKWIDLIWGHKQQGDEAVLSENTYYHLCYEQNISWPKYKSSFHKRSLEIQISEYGQVPIRLFDHAHPKKKIKIPASMAQHGVRRNDEQKILPQSGKGISGLQLNFKKKIGTARAEEQPSDLLEFSDVIGSQIQSQFQDEISELERDSEVNKTEFMINQDSGMDLNNESDNGVATDLLNGFPDLRKSHNAFREY